MNRNIINTGIICRCYTALFAITLACSCQKLIQVPPPTQTITTEEVFQDSANALGAIAGIYSQMINTNGLAFGDGNITVDCGASADELRPFESSGDNLSTNTLTPVRNQPFSDIWIPAYNFIYETNDILVNLPGAAAVPDQLKVKISAEARFFRGLVYFYLVNLYGEVPLLTTIDYKANTLAFKSSVKDVYAFIKNDLLAAAVGLPLDYSDANGERIRATRWAADALLARVYLYNGQYDSAEIMSSSIINNSALFALTDSLSDVFSENSSEAILQWQVNSQLNTSTYNATSEGTYFIRRTPYSPTHYITSQLLDAFESGDRRKQIWMDSTNYDDGTSVTTYFYPYKYQVGYDGAFPNAQTNQYYMVLRLAEQYLIRAECYAQRSDISDALQDLNHIRHRAGLNDYAGTVDAPSVLSAILHERQVELFAEWGHRWMDLKRTGTAGSILSVIPYKSQWQDYQQLYPIALSELREDPNLRQNPGYQY